MNLETKIFACWIVLFLLSYLFARLDYAKHGYPLSFKYYNSPMIGIFYILKYFGIGIWCLFGFIQVFYYLTTGGWLSIFN
jgi:hypothetical protein